MSGVGRSGSLESPAERAVRLWVEATDRHGIDPLFRRRLRGAVLNRYVAGREAPERSVTLRRRSGSLARACLYATVALGLSVGGAMAASTAAIPGDLLYPVKRQIEEVRVAVLPAQFRDELAAHEFAQRLNELGRLLAAGDEARAAALLAEVESAYERLLVLRPAAGGDDLVAAQVAVLESLLERLPPQAADAIERALEHAPGVNRTVEPGRAGDGGPPLEEPRGGSGGDGGEKGSPAIGNGHQRNDQHPAVSPSGSAPPAREPRERESERSSPSAFPSDAGVPVEPEDEER